MCLFVAVTFCVPTNFQSEDEPSSPADAHNAGSTPSHAHHISSTSSEDQYGITELFKPDNAPPKGDKEQGAEGGGGQDVHLDGVQPSESKDTAETKPLPLSSDHKLKAKVCDVQCVLISRPGINFVMYGDTCSYRCGGEDIIFECR